MVMRFISKFINKVKTKSTLKWSLSLLIVVGLIYIIVVALNNNSEDNDKLTVKPYLNQNKISVDKNLTYAVQMNKDILLTADSFGSDPGGLGNKYKNIYTYDIKSGEEKSVVSTEN